MLKHEIKNILIQFFVQEDVFDSSATHQILVTQTGLQLRKLEIKRQVEKEKLRLEHEERLRPEKYEREDRIRHGTLRREDRLLREKNKTRENKVRNGRKGELTKKTYISH